MAMLIRLSFGILHNQQKNVQIGLLDGFCTTNFDTAMGETEIIKERSMEDTIAAARTSRTPRLPSAGRRLPTPLRTPTTRLKLCHLVCIMFFISGPVLATPLSRCMACKYSSMRRLGSIGTFGIRGHLTFLCS